MLAMQRYAEQRFVAGGIDEVIVRSEFNAAACVAREFGYDIFERRVGELNRPYEPVLNAVHEYDARCPLFADLRVA
jgi:hypothetical protein